MHDEVQEGTLCLVTEFRSASSLLPSVSHAFLKGNAPKGAKLQMRHNKSKKKGADM